MSTIRPPPVPATFASPLPIPGLLVLAPANTPIYLTQLSGTRPTLAAYGIPALHISGSEPIPGAYIQSSSTRFPPAAYTLSGTGPTLAANIQPPGIEPSPAGYKQSSGATLGEYIQSS